MIYVLTKEPLAIVPEGITYIDDKEVIIGYLKERNPKVLGLDTETTGLNFLDNEMVMLQIGDLEVQFIIDVRYYSIDFLKPWLESKEVIKVLQNATFDYKFIRRKGIVTEKIFDTRLADKVINGGKVVSSALDELSMKYLNEYMEKDTGKTFLTHRGPFTERQIRYGARDVTSVLKIREKQKKIIKRDDHTATIWLEMKAALAFSDIEYNGIEIDEDKWIEKSNETLGLLKKAKIELDNIIEEDPTFKEFQDPAKQLDFFKSDDEISFVNINWDSPKKVLNIFQKILPKLESVGADVLSTIEPRPPILRSYIRYKKLAKLYSSYGPSMLDLIWSDGKIHTNFNQILNTGRVSSSKPNMQQIPADNSFRNCFVSKDPNWVFVSSDYSSQELCVIATVSNDPVWLDALKSGKDLHSVCADLVFGEKWIEAAEEDCAYFEMDSTGEPLSRKCNCPDHKYLRDAVKAINFGLAYGMSEYALADRMMISVEEARDLIKTYFNTFPMIKGTLTRFGEFGKTNGYVTTMPPFMRKRYFPDHKYIDTDPQVSGSIERRSKNTPIQGSSADMTKLAMIYVRDYINEHLVPVKMVMTVHDQLDTIVHKDFAPEWKEILTQLMERAALKIIKNGLLKAETDITPVWTK